MLLVLIFSLHAQFEVVASYNHDNGYEPFSYGLRYEHEFKWINLEASGDRVDKTIWGEATIYSGQLRFKIGHFLIGARGDYMRYDFGHEVKSWQPAIGVKWSEGSVGLELGDSTYYKTARIWGRWDLGRWGLKLWVSKPQDYDSVGAGVDLSFIVL